MEWRKSDAKCEPIPAMYLILRNRGDVVTKVMIVRGKLFLYTPLLHYKKDRKYRHLRNLRHFG